MNGMTDVMQVLSDELEQIPNNNPNGVNYLEKLVANDVFVDRLIANKAFIRELVADDAFITNLASKIITLQEHGQIKSYWADNDIVFTSVIEDDDVFEIYTADGVWESIEIDSGEYLQYCLSNVYTDSPSNLTYRSACPTVEELNQYSYLFVKATRPTQTGARISYDTLELKKPYFKLDGDTGKIEARHLVATGALFNSINVNEGTLMNVKSKLCNFDSVIIEGESLFKGQIISGPLELTNEGVMGKKLILTSGMNYSQILTAINNAGFDYDGKLYPVNPLLSTFDSQPIKSIYFNIYREASASTAKYIYIMANHANVEHYSITAVVGNQESSRPTTLNKELFITQDSPNSYTFKLKNIPTIEPSTSGVVWNDNGTLKIVP